MKFLIDANLSYKLKKLFIDKKLDVIHTDDLPNKEKTTDKEIRDICEEYNRIVITKDIDFLDSYIVNNIPPKLLLVTTGNIRNNELFNLIVQNIDRLIELLNEYNFVELSNDRIIGHE